MTDPLADVRTSYEAGSLREQDLAATPLEQFTRWFDDARTAGFAGTAEPSSMVLSTAAALIAVFLGAAGNPLFFGLAISALCLVPCWLRHR